MANPAGAIWWMFNRVGHPTRVQWVLFGHQMSPAPGEWDHYSQEQKDAAEAIVTAWERLHPEGDTDPNVPPPLPAPVPDPPPPPIPATPPPTPLAKGMQCPACGGQWPR